jgi:hypothetical protein
MPLVMKQEPNGEAERSPRSELRLAKKAAPPPNDPPKDDGTRQLLRGGGWTIVALMCLPFGSLLFLLGAAKWLRNRRLQRDQRSLR